MNNKIGNQPDEIINLISEFNIGFRNISLKFRKLMNDNIINILKIIINKYGTISNMIANADPEIINFVFSNQNYYKNSDYPNLEFNFFQKPNIKKLVFPNGDSNDILYHAIQRNYSRIIQYALENDAGIDPQFPYKYNEQMISIIRYLIDNKKIDILKIILNYGNRNSIDKLYDILYLMSKSEDINMRMELINHVFKNYLSGGDIEWADIILIPHITIHEIEYIYNMIIKSYPYMAIRLLNNIIYRAVKENIPEILYVINKNKNIDWLKVIDPVNFRTEILVKYNNIFPIILRDYLVKSNIISDEYINKMYR